MDPKVEECRLKIDAEVILVSTIASNLMRQGIERQIAVEEAYRVVELVIARQDEKLGDRFTKEAKRRRGY